MTMLDLRTRRARRGTWLGLSTGLVAVTLFAAAGPACSGEHDTRVILPEEGGPTKEAGDGGGSPGASCPSDVPMDAATFASKSPTAPQQGKCQDDDIVAMQQFLAKNASASNEDFEAFVKNRDPVCHDCIFADADGPTWSPAPTKNGQVLTFNVGACYTLVTGRESCGRAVQNAWDCGFEACTACASGSELPACRAKARTGPCASIEARVGIECSIGPSADGVCGSPFDSIRVQCVTTSAPVSDAGSD